MASSVLAWGLPTSSRSIRAISFAEIGAMREVSERTVQRDWNKARLFLHDVLRES